MNPFRRLELLTLALAGCVLFLSGCQPAKEDASTAADAAGSSQRMLGPAFAKATFPAVRTALAADFEVTDEQGTATFAKAAADLRTEIAVRHDGQGRIHSVGAKVVGPLSAAPQMAKECHDLVTLLIKTLKLPIDDILAQHAGLGMIRNAAGVQYSFYCGLSLVTLKPAANLAQKQAATTPPANPRQGTETQAESAPTQPQTKSDLPESGPQLLQREIVVVPLRAAEPSAYRPILESSTEQLAKLLEGFEKKFDIDGKEQLYVRDAQTHRELVHCRADAKHQILWIEAFAYDVTDGSKLDQHNRDLWLKLTELEFQDSDPSAARSFLTGPMPQYAVDAEQNVGSACFCLPICPGGKRIYFNIWGVRPPRS